VKKPLRGGQVTLESDKHATRRMLGFSGDRWKAFVSAATVEHVHPGYYDNAPKERGRIESIKTSI